jgi:hypothetical protein
MVGNAEASTSNTESVCAESEREARIYAATRAHKERTINEKSIENFPKKHTFKRVLLHYSALRNPSKIKSAVFLGGTGILACVILESRFKPHRQECLCYRSQGNLSTYVAGVPKGQIYSRNWEKQMVVVVAWEKAKTHKSVKCDS